MGDSILDDLDNTLRVFFTQSVLLYMALYSKKLEDSIEEDTIEDMRECIDTIVHINSIIVSAGVRRTFVIEQNGNKRIDSSLSDWIDECQEFIHGFFTVINTCTGLNDNERENLYILLGCNLGE